MSTLGRIPLARLRDLGLPVPPLVRIDATAADDRLRQMVTAGVAAFGGPASRRLGSGSDPLFVAVSAGTDGAQTEGTRASAAQVVFLGTTAESLTWLADHGSRELADSLRRRDLSAEVAHDPIDQIVRALRSLKTPSVTLLPMVLGCYADTDGTGLARSRDLGTGRARLNGFFLPGSCGTTSGEDPRARQLTDFTAEPWWSPLAAAVVDLERHCRDAIELEFAIQDERLWVLGARPAPREAAEACTVAAAFLAEGRIDPADALSRVSPSQFAVSLRPATTGPEAEAVVGHGLGVSPGSASGIATFDPARAVERGKRGDPVVFIRSDTRPEDLTALAAAAAVVTIRGGRTSHAAVVARAMDRPCVVGLADASIDRAGGMLDLCGVTIADGDMVTVDGSRGILALGAHASGSPMDSGQPPGQAAQRLLGAADAQRRMEVWANAETADDAAAARRAGAAGIGLCRTEHMFLGVRQRMLADILLGVYDSTAQEALDELHRSQRADFLAILTAMDGLPVTVRLLDPPRHEFLPDLTDVSVQAAVAAVHGNRDPAAERRLRAVERAWERNPMLGVRGIRLGVLLPWLYEMQIAALLEATVARIQAHGDPHPLLLVPMVATAAELRPVRLFNDYLLGELQPLADRELTLPIGAMIETPRAALTAADLAEAADFFSFGTNDLTQLTWGLSRDDAETTVLRSYQARRLIEASPFQRLDRSGVGQLVLTAVRAGRRVRPGMRMGVCGEHAADPDSIQSFHDWGLDYISCSRQDLALARYTAGYAARMAHPDLGRTERGRGEVPTDGTG